MGQFVNVVISSIDKGSFGLFVCMYKRALVYLGSTYRPQGWHKSIAKITFSDTLVPALSQDGASEG